MTLSISEYLDRGPATSKAIQVATGLSQTAVSRQLRALGSSVIKLQTGRTPRYAMTRNAFGGDDKLPLVMVDAHGNTTLVATLRPLAHGGFFVKSSVGMPQVLLGEKNNGLYDDLPYFLYDLCPQGFIGRQIAEQMAAQSPDFPTDPRRWNVNHIGRYLVSNGDDLPGNFKFGSQALYRIRQKPIANTEEEYPKLADNVMNGILPGSSAGGEQPKFTAFCASRSAHVIVKFSPLGNNEIAKRWKDILITEYHASQAIHQNGAFPAAETKLFEMDGRLFLESQRFDRVAEYGRMSMISLKAVDAEFTGLGSDWPSVLNALNNKQLISHAHVYDAEVLWNFGRLINNTDMHLGNLSLGIEGNVFRLLPIYDMCSMGFAPRVGEVSPYKFSQPKTNPLNLNDDVLAISKVMAQNFWARVANDARISDEFKDYLDKSNPMDVA